MPFNRTVKGKKILDHGHEVTFSYTYKAQSFC